MNKADRWHRISELFDRVVELPAPEREAVLAAECADDPHLRTEVERLLQADERTNPIDQDIAGQASTLLLEGDAHEHEGQQFGPYRIVKLLAQGGMGRVYLAEREGEDFAQTVALKLVGGYGSFDAYTARRRFLDERRILARLQHPNIARLLDGGVGPEAQPWFAMEYVDGAPLTDWCDHQQLDVHQRLALFAKVCEAVDHAHRFLIVHRDLKPGNVLVDNRGEPKVLDFGIAKLLDEGAADRTGSTILMTPDYAAPEQIRGGQISTATDVYALGAVLFEVLTGRKPFVDPLASREAPQASRAVTEGVHAGERALARSTTPQALRKHLRGDVDRILRTALDPDPVRRYRSAATLAQDLRAVAEGKAISLRSDRRYRAGVFLRRHKWEAAAATIAVLGLLGTTGWALLQTRQAIHQANLAAAHASEEARQSGIAKREALTSEKVSDVLISAFHAADPTTRGTKAQPSAKDILDATAAQIDEELAESPEVLARMQLALGHAYMNLGETERAKPLLEKAADAFQTTAVNDPQRATDAIALMAMTEMNRRNEEKAISLSRRLVAMRAKLGKPDELANAYSILGMALMSPHHTAEAEQVAAQAYSSLIATHGILSKDGATSLRNWAHLSQTSGKFVQAIRLFEAAQAVNGAIDGTEQAQYSTRGLLALAQMERGLFSESERNLLRNLEEAPNFYPPNSNALTRLNHRLGHFYLKKGDAPQARRYYEAARRIEMAVSGDQSANMGVILGDLARAVEATGDSQSAGPLYKQSKAIVEAAMPADDGERLRAVAYHEAFLLKSGAASSPDGAKKAVDAWISVYPSQRRFIPPDLAEALFLKTQLLARMGQFEVALETLPPEDSTGESPPREVWRSYWQAVVEGRSGKHEQAAADLRRAIGRWEAMAGRRSLIAAGWRLDLSEEQLHLGQGKSAMEQLALAAPVLREQLKPGSPQLARLDELGVGKGTMVAKTAR